MDKKRIELMVGSFVAAAVVIFFILVFSVSGMYFLRDGYRIGVKFDYIGGLEQGSPVRLAGVRIGEVQDVVVKYDQQTQRPYVMLDLWIQGDARIKKDAEVYIFGTFALSETHLEIISNSASIEQFIRPGAVLRGVAPVPMERLVEQSMEIAGMFDMVGQKLNAMVNDDALLEALRETTINMHTVLKYTADNMESGKLDFVATLEQIESLGAELELVLKTINNGEGTVGKLLKEEQMYLDLLDLVEDVKRHPWKLLRKTKEADDE